MSDTYLGQPKPHLAIICKGGFATDTSLMLISKPEIQDFLLLTS